MSENTQGHFKQYFITALIIFLVVIVGFQAWYMMSMNQRLDDIQSKHEAISGVTSSGSPASASNATVSQTPPVANAPSVTRQIPNNLNAQAQTGQQGHPIPLDPPSAFDDDFFNHPFGGGNWNPYAEIERMQRDMDRMFNNAFSRFNNSPEFHNLFEDSTSVPQMDVQEGDSEYTVILNLPGADEKNISVNLDGQQLTVRGEQDFDQQKKDAAGNVIFQERHTGTFQRSITLPEPVKQNGMATHVDNGVLTITVPKVS